MRFNEYRWLPFAHSLSFRAEGRGAVSHSANRLFFQKKQSTRMRPSWHLLVLGFIVFANSKSAGVAAGRPLHFSHRFLRAFLFEKRPAHDYSPVPNSETFSLAHSRS